MITLTAVARCQWCEWTAAGEWGDVDRQAERHMQQAQHAVGTMASVSQPTAAARAEQAAAEARDRQRAADSLTDWAVRWGRRVDPGISRQILDAAAQLQRPSDHPASL